MIGPGPGESSSDSYNRIPYPSYPYSQTHPDHLAALGILTGISPEPVNNCRILDLGCASGGNLIPIAYSLPGSECLGIDFSEDAINRAKESASKLPLDNITFLEMDFANIDRSLGKFDYIIAHGIFSWVSKEVQKVLLSTCKELLSPNGIAYFSYNVYPGWHMRGMIRDMMCYHAERFDEPATRIAQARGLLDFLAKNASQDTAYGKLLAGEVDILKDHEDGYLFHDHLGTVESAPAGSDRSGQVCPRGGTRRLQLPDRGPKWRGWYRLVLLCLGQPE